MKRVWLVELHGRRGWYPLNQFFLSKRAAQTEAQIVCSFEELRSGDVRVVSYVREDPKNG